MWEPRCCFHLKKCQHPRGMTCRVTAVISGTVGQLVPAQAAQSEVGICRERQNLALPAGFFCPGRQAQDAHHCL